MEDLFYISQEDFDSYKEEQLRKLKDQELFVDTMCTEYIEKKENISTQNKKLISKKENLRSLLQEDLLIIKNNNKQLSEECEDHEKKNEQMIQEIHLKLENLAQLQSKRDERDKKMQFLKNNMKTLMKVNIKSVKLYELLLGIEIEPIGENQIRIHFHEAASSSFICLLKEKGIWRLSSYPSNCSNDLSQQFEQTQDLIGLLCYFHSFLIKKTENS